PRERDAAHQTNDPFARSDIQNSESPAVSSIVDAIVAPSLQNLPPPLYVAPQLPPFPALPPPYTAVPHSPYATWSLVVGVLGIICFGAGPVFGLIAIVLGILGWRQVKKGHGQMRGR